LLNIRTNLHDFCSLARKIHKIC